MIRARSALAAAVLWATALTWLVMLPHQERMHRLLLSIAVAATTRAAIDRHAAQFREVVRLTLLAAAYDENSRVPPGECPAEDGDSWRG